MIPLRVYVFIAALLVLAFGEGVLCLHFYLKGEHKIEYADYQAVKQHDADTAAQAAKDKADDADAIDELRAELAAANHSLAALPAPRPIRVCYANGGDQGRPAGPAAGGAQPADPPGPGNNPGLLAGDQLGPDVSADVRTLADAGVVLAIYRERLAAWATAQSTPPMKGTSQ